MDEVLPVEHDQLMPQEEQYKGFVITWPEPPQTGAGWTLNISSDDPMLFATLGQTVVMNAPTLEQALEKARLSIDL